MAARDPQLARGPVRMLRLGGILTSVLAAVGLVLLPPAAGGGRAQADSGSAVTKSGAKGAYDDFSRLKVTVEQTANLTTQGVKINWTGGEPTTQNGGVFVGNYLQIMQCWGSEAGPSPEQCEFGQPPVPSPVLNATRTVTPRDDPQEPTERDIPFTTATGQSSTDVSQYFTQFTTNEQDLAVTGSDGTGETVFSLEDDTTSQILGCGASRQSGQTPPPCWLVVVPRGMHEADGSAPQFNGLSTSALSATNWKQRIQFRMDFRPTESPCVIGQDEQPTTGSDFAFQAMTSWEPKLCTSDKITYQFTPQLEDLSRQQIANPDGNAAGLAFVENPVAPQPDAASSPPVVYAPTAVSGLVIGYNVNVSGTTRQVPHLRLNARLVAKMITQSYSCDLPTPPNSPPFGRLDPKNAKDLAGDPEFKQLNSDVHYGSSSSCDFSLGVPQAGSDGAAMLWTWLRSDPAAKAFLEGKADPWGMKINPYYLALDPAHTALSDFGKPDSTVYLPDPKGHPDTRVTGIDVNPYMPSLFDTARIVRNGTNGAIRSWVFGGGPPLAQKDPRALPGQSFMMGLTDAASAARYRLGTAELLNADGQFVAPTVDSLTKAVNGMKAGKVPGVLDQDPARKTPGAYPLTTVTYAAGNASMDAAQRAKYATLIRYAVGAGQQPGISYGQLPFGYAPLTPTLHDQALAAATALVAGVVPTSQADGGAGGGSGSGSGSGGGASGGSAGGGSGAAGGGNGTSGGGSSGGSPSPTPAAAATKGAAGGPSASPPVHNVADSGGTTPGMILGAVRWVLMIVLIAGIAGSLAGPLLMRAGVLHASGRPLLNLRRSRTT
ncbi:hypothetical protein [Streptomyces sp. NPDC020917]|uniref:hypothetical protein n=1 Tax=Streptomyces sp. NPDC020917 TaxID=3365102 RepID=UPI0037975633